MDDALHAAEERLRRLYEATPAMLHSIDSQGRLLSVSDVWLEKLGYARSEVIGRLSSDFLTAESRAHARNVVLPEFFRTGRCERVEYRMVRADGAVIDVLLSAVLERDADGQPLRSLAVIDDVTEIRARTAELQREHDLRLEIERHARDLDRLLAERDEMLDVLAHEVRQPLNNASAALQSAAAVLGEQHDRAVSARLQRARDVLGHVLAGLDNTLAVASQLAATGPAEIEDADIDTLIAVVIGDMPAAERARVHVERATATRTASMNMGLMRLALRNLIANALAYSPAESPVTVRIADSDEPLALILEVVDVGAGFDPELVPRLFARGVRGAGTKREAGHGLGLYIVRRVMELHRGQVLLARNRPGDTAMRLVVPQSGF